MRKSVVERADEYRKANPEQVKLTREKQKLRVLKKRVEDVGYDEEVKKRSRERKKVYREKKASEIGNSENKKVSQEKGPENNVETDPTSSRSKIKSRQSVKGLVIRKKTNIEKNKTIYDLVESNKSLEYENYRVNISMQETVDENKKLHLEIKKKDNEIGELRKKLIENDQWLKSDYKYMTSAGKK